MAYGIIEYDDNGNPICEICGKGFSKVISHVWQSHEMSGKEYKKEYGFDINKGIINRQLAQSLRHNVLSHYDDVIKPLIEAGAKSRFKQGHGGRTRDKVSEQTRISLSNRIHKVLKQNRNEKAKQ